MVATAFCFKRLIFHIAATLAKTVTELSCKKFKLSAKIAAKKKIRLLQRRSQPWLVALRSLRYLLFFSKAFTKSEYCAAFLQASPVGILPVNNATVTHAEAGAISELAEFVS
jgi:hypothetical protein